MKMKLGHGEHLEIMWEWEPDFEAFHGHITYEEAVESLAAAGHQEDLIAGDKKVVHLWARWIPDSTHSYDFRFHVEKKSKRGNWPVTLI